MAKTPAVSSEKVLSLVDRLLPDSGTRESLDVLRRDADGSELDTLFQQVLVEGIRRLRDQGAEASAKIPLFVSEVISMAQGLNADVTTITAQAMAAIADPASLTARAPRKDTKRQILEAALQLFSDQGFHETTVDQIADKAGLGKGTVYRYFPNKEALYQGMIREKWDELTVRVQAEFSRDGDVFDNIRGATRVYLEFFESNVKLYRILLKEPLDFERKVRAQYMDMMLLNVPKMKDRIVGESKTGTRIKRNVNFYSVFYGYMGFMEGIIQKWVRNECKHSLVAELDMIMEVMLYGFAEHIPVDE